MYQDGLGSPEARTGCCAAYRMDTHDVALRFRGVCWDLTGQRLVNLASRLCLCCAVAVCDVWRPCEGGPCALGMEGATGPEVYARVWMEMRR